MPKLQSGTITSHQGTFTGIPRRSTYSSGIGSAGDYLADTWIDGGYAVTNCSNNTTSSSYTLASALNLD